MENEFKLNELLNRFHIKPKNKKLYEEAFTHPSMNIYKKDIIDYQRLEFVGDSILGAIIATLSYKIRPTFHEGELTRLRSSLVDTKSLSQLALNYHFDEYILVSDSLKENLKNLPSVLEDVFEAFIGAVYLDLGFNFTYKMINKIFYKEIQRFNYEDAIDYKSKIQEILQLEKKSKINYSTKSVGKTNNSTDFESSLIFDNVCLGKGNGASKKEAEQNAAKDALSKMAKGN